MVVKNIFKTWEITILIGPQFNRIEKINEIILNKKLIVNVLQAPDNIANVLANADLALIAFGVTAYELAACYVPFFAISITPDHERSVNLFEENKLCISLGQVEGFEQRLINAMINYTNNKFQIKNKILNKELRICNYEMIIKAIIN